VVPRTGPPVFLMTIREIQESDAAAFLALCRRLDEETKFMLLEPGERTTTEEEQHQRITAILSQENQTLLLAENNEKPVGFVAGLGGPCRRNRHCAHVVMGVLQAFCGQGIGQRLLVELEAWARGHDMRRLELTVMAHNARALKLYEKVGFVREGIKRHALVVDGRPVDELCMAKLIDA